MKRALVILSVLINLFLGGYLLYLRGVSNPTVARVENSIGKVREVKADDVRRELANRHAEDVLGDLAGREIVTLAAEESKLKLDVEELEARWHLWVNDPAVRASLDSGDTTEQELRSKLTTLVLLDQLTLNDLNPQEREDVIKAFYEKHGRDLEQVRLRHILLDSEKDAEDVAQRLAAGVDFGQLAQRFSLDPITRDQGGDLGWKTRDELPETLSPLLFLMPVGRASKPLATEHGWHLFLIENKRTDYQDLRDFARRRWCERRRPDTLSALRERFKVDTPPKEELTELLRPYFDKKRAPEEERGELKL